MGRPAPATQSNGSQPFISPPRRFLNTAARRGTAPAYYVHDEKGWVGTAWNVYRAEVRQAARALVALGVKDGDVVAVLGYNRPEWVIMDLAAMMVAASVAGIYFTSWPQNPPSIIIHPQLQTALPETHNHTP